MAIDFSKPAPEAEDLSILRAVGGAKALPAQANPLSSYADEAHRIMGGMTAAQYDATARGFKSQTTGIIDQSGATLRREVTTPYGTGSSTTPLALGGVSPNVVAPIPVAPPKLNLNNVAPAQAPSQSAPLWAENTPRAMQGPIVLNAQGGRDMRWDELKPRAMQGPIVLNAQGGQDMRWDELKPRGTGVASSGTALDVRPDTRATRAGSYSLIANPSELDVDNMDTRSQFREVRNTSLSNELASVMKLKGSQVTYLNPKGERVTTDFAGADPLNNVRKAMFTAKREGNTEALTAYQRYLKNAER